MVPDLVSKFITIRKNRCEKVQEDGRSNRPRNKSEDGQEQQERDAKLRIMLEMTKEQYIQQAAAKKRVLPHSRAAFGTSERVAWLFAYNVIVDGRKQLGI
jgi:hypothetical protein